MQLSNDLCKKKEDEEKKELEKQERINKIKRNIELGNIDTKEEKEYYLKSLKESLSIKSIIKKCTNKFKERIKKISYHDILYDEIYTLGVILSLVTVMVLCLYQIGLNYIPVLLAYCFISLGGLINYFKENKYDPINIIKSFALFPIDLIKESLNKESRLTRHKIKVLEGTLRPAEEEKEEIKESKQLIIILIMS